MARGSGIAQPQRLSVDTYHQMIDQGVFDEDDKVELIEGVLVEMSPQSKLHVHALQRLMLRLLDALPRSEWSVRPQMPITLDDSESEPEPDLAVMRTGDVERAERHPSTAALVVEVSKRSISADRRKARLYAAAGVTEYWIVDVVRRRIEVYREPIGDEYRRCEIVDEAGAIRPVAFPEIEVRVAELMLPSSSTASDS